MRRLFPLCFSFLLLMSGASFAFAAACCGGSLASPTLMAGDDRAQISTSYSQVDVAVDHVDARGIWKLSEASQKVETFKLEMARLLTDRWQAGVSLPLLRRSRQGQSESGWGDLSASFAYEALTDWDYHPYRPKGLVFVQITVPTGLSRAESDKGGFDSRGNGFWALGTGALFTKAFGSFDLFSSLEAHRSFSKSFANSNMSGTLHPGWGGSLGLGAGYNTKSWRWGGALTWRSEDPIEVRGTVASAGVTERDTTASLSVSYLQGALWSTTLSYTDQTLFGDPQNTSLGRGLTLLFQRRWAR